MAVRETATVGNIRQRRVMHRRQVRYFAFIWTGITLIIGACTFAAIYTTTGLAARSSSPASNAQLPPVDNSGALVAQITATPFPTFPAATQTQQAPTAQPPTAQPVAVQATPTIVPIKDTDFDLGIAIQENPDPNTYILWTKMAGEQLKLNWVKAQVSWRDAEKVKGQYDFGALDNDLKLLSAANIKVLLSVTKAPDWARDPGAKNQPGVYDGPPANPKDLADFLTALLQRHPGQIHAIEVWNEANLDREWSTSPQKLDAARYVQLLKTAHDAIKAVDPNIIVVSGALSPTGANIPGQAIDDFVYMDQLIQAGMLQFVDCVGAHHNGLNVPPNADWNNIPERNPRAKFRGPWDNPHHSWSFKSTLEGYASRIQKAGSNLKLCVTEFGWPSVEDLKGRGNLRQGFEFAADNTLADQATFTAQAIDLMQQWGFVRLAFIWNLNYGPQAGWNIGGAVGDNVPWSIIGPDFSNRPVWQKIVDMNFRGRARKASQ